MDFGNVRNLLVWTDPKHEKPIRINDNLLTVEDTIQLIKLLKITLKKYNR